MLTSGQQSASFCDGGKLAIPDVHTLALHKEKYPVNTDPEGLERLTDPSKIKAWQISVDEVLEATRTFPEWIGGRTRWLQTGTLVRTCGIRRGGAPAGRSDY